MRGKKKKATQTELILFMRFKFSSMQINMFGEQEKVLDGANESSTAGAPIEPLRKTHPNILTICRHFLWMDFHFILAAAKKVDFCCLNWVRVLARLIKFSMWTLLSMLCHEIAAHSEWLWVHSYDIGM